MKQLLFMTVVVWFALTTQAQLISSTSEVNFGEVTARRRVSRSAVLTNVGAETLLCSLITDCRAPFITQTSCIGPIVSGTNCRIQVSYEAPATATNFSCNIHYQAQSSTGPVVSVGVLRVSARSVVLQKILPLNK